MLCMPHAVRTAKEEKDVAPLLDALTGEMQATFTRWKKNTPAWG